MFGCRVCAESVYQRIRAFFQAQVEEDIGAEAPSMTEWSAMWALTLIMREMYEIDPDSVGPVGSEPRDTWDAGGTIDEGHAALWGEPPQR